MIKKIKNLFDLNQTQVKATEKILQQIRDERLKIKDWSFDQMRTRVDEMKAELKPMVDKIPFENKLSTKKIDRLKGLSKAEKDIQAKLYEFLPEVYAFIGEVYQRKLGFSYNDRQYQSGIVLAQGQRLVEQYTGEGKTMTFQLPLFLYAIAGRGAHLVTVNDYLSRRDGEYAGHVASELGLSVGIITSNASYKFIKDDQLKVYKGDEAVNARKEMKSLDMSQMSAVNLIESSKRDAYNTDITYGTNNEFGFDYLRDNMAWDLNNISQRELYFCVIDEADSILIDEARTPLIISGVPSDANTDRYMNFAVAVKDLVEDVDYIIDHKTRSVTLTEDGIKNVENKLGVDNLWKDYSLAYHIENALK
jgi:preprotein translocase subunit SecA